MLARAYLLIYSTFNLPGAGPHWRWRHRESPGYRARGPWRALGVGEAMSGAPPHPHPHRHFASVHSLGLAPLAARLLPRSGECRTSGPRHPCLTGANLTMLPILYSG